MHESLSHLKPIDLKTQTHPLGYKPLECKFMVGTQNSLCGELFVSSESDFGSHNYDFSISAALFLVFSLCVSSVELLRRGAYLQRKLNSFPPLGDIGRDFGMSDDIHGLTKHLYEGRARGREREASQTQFPYR